MCYQQRERIKVEMQEKITFRDYLGTKELYVKMAKIAIPISCQSLITVGINLMDTIMLSEMGDAQLSASSLAGQFINIFMICCMGMGMGASVMTSRFWGMKDKVSLKKAVTIMVRLLICFASAFTIATIITPGGIMRIYTGDPDIIRHGITYLNWIIPTYFCMGIATTCTVVLRSVGQVKIPLYSSIAAFFINIFFNWVFIFGKLGAPRMEIAGAALGTLIARGFEMCFIGGHFFFVDKRIGYRLRDILMKCSDMFKEYLRISIPVLISDALLALGNNAVAMVMGRIGSAFVAANSVTMVVQQLSSVLTQGISNASGIITGHTMGEGDYKKAQRQGYTFLIIGFLIGCFAALVILILRNPIIGYYNVSAEAKEIAHELMNAILIIVIFQAMNSILTKGVLRAGGDTKFLMAGDILFLWIASVPLGALAGLVFHWPAFWIYVCLKIDQIIKCVWCFFRLKSGKWLKKIKQADSVQA
ncbi:MAG: MATE family efflux transporter [Clostridia bacterium]|nr:MATE family efflux transporter [Clostridia bacterium]MBQ4637558.1 MATE family efflux transporter [Clostridia bacterium]